MMNALLYLAVRHVSHDDESPADRKPDRRHHGGPRSIPAWRAPQHESAARRVRPRTGHDSSAS